MGPYGHARQKSPLQAGAHIAQRETSGFSDRKGYEASESRRMGRHTGPAPKYDQRRSQGAEGNGKGSPPPGLGRGKGIQGSPNSHLGTAGRGAPGKFGKGDGYKGRASYPEDISHSQFESLGAK
jgi:hypothetical protein